MKNPKLSLKREIILSVCLITYNHEKFIRKALEGILNQKINFEYELIIGDDHSTDLTINIIEEYRSLFPINTKILRSSINEGLNHNFLRSFNACTGKYIAYLEGDDCWINDKKLQSQVEILENYNDVSLVHTNCKLWNIKTGEILDSIIMFEGQCIREKTFGLSSVNAEFAVEMRPIKTSTCCYRRELLKNAIEKDYFAYSNKEFTTQDFQLFQDLSMVGKFYFIDEDTTLIGLHDSLSANTDLVKQVNFRLGFFKIGIYYADKYKIPKNIFLKWLRIQIYYFNNVCFILRDKKIIKYVVNEAMKRGYTLTFRQKILYTAINSRLWRYLIPLYRIYSKFK